MKVEDLIKKLQDFPSGTNVCVFDHRKSLARDTGDFNSEGVYSDFDISFETLGKEETEYLKDVEDIDYVPWISISFDNEDYDDEGKCLLENE